MTIPSASATANPSLTRRSATTLDPGVSKTSRKDKSVRVDIGLTARLYNNLHQIYHEGNIEDFWIKRFFWSKSKNFSYDLGRKQILNYCDLFPNLVACLRWQSVLSEKLTELRDSLTLSPVHFTNPSGQVGVGPNVARTLNVGSLEEVQKVKELESKFLQQILIE